MMRAGRSLEGIIGPFGSASNLSLGGPGPREALASVS